MFQDITQRTCLKCAGRIGNVGVHRQEHHLNIRVTRLDLPYGLNTIQ